MLETPLKIAQAPTPRSVVAPRAVRRFGRLSLANQFLVASFTILVVGVTSVGGWVSQQIEAGVMNRTGAVTALYVESVLSEPLQQLTAQPRLQPGDIAALDRVLTATPLGQHIQAFRVWSTTGEILYSSDHSAIGQRFPVQNGLERAARGEVAVDVSELTDAENADLRAASQRLLEVYAPVHDEDGTGTVAAVEFYQRLDELDADLAFARWRSWLIVAGAGLISYLLLAGIVNRGSDTIARQQGALREQVSELERLLDQNRRVMEQNARLHERVRRAAGRTTALNEQGLRRVSADLIAGPAQSLALAALRLDTVRSQCEARCPVLHDFTTVHEAVGDALSEVKAISFGMRLPELEPLSVVQLAERAVRKHVRQTGTEVTTDFVGSPEQAPLPIKIALYRALEEGLSNAARHGHGRAVRAAIRRVAGRLELTISDAGPGFDTAEIGNGDGLGLAAVRERAELLGGTAQVDSTRGQGTTLRVWLPLPNAQLSSAADAGAVVGRYSAAAG